MIQPAKRNDDVFIFRYRDGAFESIPVNSKKSSSSNSFKKFKEKLKSFGSKKS